MSSNVGLNNYGAAARLSPPRLSIACGPLHAPPRAPCPLAPPDWNQVLMNIEPYYFGFVGVAFSIGFCVLGAAWYVAYMPVCMRGTWALLVRWPVRFASLLPFAWP